MGGEGGCVMWWPRVFVYTMIRSKGVHPVDMSSNHMYTSACSFTVFCGAWSGLDSWSSDEKDPWSDETRAQNDPITGLRLWERSYDINDLKNVYTIRQPKAIVQ